MKLFVYGSLMHGHPRHSILQNGGAEFLNRDVVSGYTLQFVEDGDFPALVLWGDNLVIGEIYEVSQELLSIIDEIEGVDWGLFKRVQQGETIMYILTSKAIHDYELKLSDWGIFRLGHCQLWVGYQP